MKKIAKDLRMTYLWVLPFLLAVVVGSKPAQAQPFAYATNRHVDSVSVIDTATNTVVGAPILVGANPAGVAITPDGTRAYVTVTGFGFSNVTAIDTDPSSPNFNTVVGAPILVEPIPRGRGVAITPDGTRAYVTHGLGVSVIDTDPSSPDFHTVVEIVVLPFPSAPELVAITPDGTRAYVAHFRFADSYVSVIDTDPSSPDFHTVVHIGPFGFLFYGMAITPDGTRAYLADSFRVVVLDTDPSSPDFHTVVEIGWAGNARAVAITPDGTRAYVTNSGGSDIVSVIDTDPSSPDFHTVVEIVGVGGGGDGVAITPGFSTPEDQIEALIEDVEELFIADILNVGQANSLISKLENILNRPEQGTTQPVINQLGAFINQVLSLVEEGILTPEEGQDLVDAAQAVIDQLSE